MIGKKSMHKDLPRRDDSVGEPTEASAEIKEEQKQKLAEAIISTLAFFSLYNLPLSAKRVHELLLGMKANQSEVEQLLQFLAENNVIVHQSGLFGLKKWDAAAFNANQLELVKKWHKVDRYFSWLAMLPFVRGISVINSLALGTADSDSDIDFFVVTKPNRLYFARSVIIVLFRLLGVYKTRQKIKDRFCFGFFVSEDYQDLHSLLLKPQDPYLVFWLASMRPILGTAQYEQFMKENNWIYDYFPNLEPINRLMTIKKPNRAVKTILEILLWLPTRLAEPFLAKIHIDHTFKLKENLSMSSTTVANRQMLKLHASDMRPIIAEQYQILVDQFEF